MNTLLLSLIVVVGLISIAGAYGIYLLINPTRTAGDRLQDLGEGEIEEQTRDLIIIGQSSDEDLSGLAKMMQPASAEERSAASRQLAQAGFKHRNALEILSFTKIALAIGLPIIALPITTGFDSSLKLIGATALASIIGYVLPQAYVQNIIDKRKKDILNSFPDCLDLLVSSVEAGLGLDAAFRRVAEEMETAAPILSKEFQLVNHEISAGVPRIEALKHLSLRTGLDEIRSLVNMLAQAERFGTSVAGSLRVHAGVTREKRMARAEEEAAKVSPKITVLMILFLLPCLFIMLIGPAIIRTYRIFYG